MRTDLRTAWLRRACPAIVLASLGCASTSVQEQVALLVPPGVTVDVQESTYAVFGRTIPDIWDSLNERGPALQNRIVAGVHSWNLSWDTEWTRTADDCRVGELEIRMSTDIMMPDWRQRVGADDELIDHWDEFERQLREHEEVHREYALDTVRDLHRTILAETAPDCETARRRIEAQTAVIMERYEALNATLDERSTLTWPPRR